MLHATWCLLHRKGRKWVILSVNWNALNRESSSPLLFRPIIVICDCGKSITNHYFFDNGVENQQFPNSSFTAVVCGRRCSIKIDAVGSKRHFHVARGQGPRPEAKARYTTILVAWGLARAVIKSYQAFGQGECLCCLQAFLSYCVQTLVNLSVPTGLFLVIYLFSCIEACIWWSVGNTSI